MQSPPKTVRGIISHLNRARYLFIDREKNYLVQGRAEYLLGCVAFDLPCTGFILHLETWKIGHFSKNQGKPGIIREFSIIFIQVREKSRKTNYFVSISFSLTIGLVVRKVVALFAVSKCELFYLLL